MGQVRHGSAKHCRPAGDLPGKSADRARTLSERQYSDPLPGRALHSNVPRGAASNAALSRELGVNVKTVAKWRKRDSVEDAAMGPKVAHSTGLSIEEEAMVVAFRRHTPLPLEFKRETNDLGDRL